MLTDTICAKQGDKRRHVKHFVQRQGGNGCKVSKAVGQTPVVVLIQILVLGISSYFLEYTTEILDEFPRERRGSLALGSLAILDQLNFELFERGAPSTRLDHQRSNSPITQVFLGGSPSREHFLEAIQRLILVF